MLRKFRYASNRINRGSNYKLWKDGFHPIELNTNKMLDDRLDYVHNNPVEAGIVRLPEHYIYSSASNYQGLDTLIEIDFIV